MSFRKCTVAILVVCILSCAVGEDRARTVRRDFSTEEEETTFIKTFESFVGDAEGTTSQAYWPEGADPLNSFGLMQKIMVNDVLLQLCILSGTYTRPKPPSPNDAGNGGEEEGSTDSENPEARGGPGSFKKHTRRTSVISDLLRILRSETVDTSTPPEEDWLNDPYDLLEDAEWQFNNLCFTLFELRRLNRKLARNKEEDVSPSP